MFGATVVEGYGMTETACTISLTLPAETEAGHVGGPVPCCEVKLADIPEMAYTSADKPHPRGEVCVRGPTLFSGYYKDEAQTKEIMDSDGWLHTGDVGLWLPGGRLKIIDRKKNIFKLAQGGRGGAGRGWRGAVAARGSRARARARDPTPLARHRSDPQASTWPPRRLRGCTPGPRSSPKVRARGGGSERTKKKKNWPRPRPSPHRPTPTPNPAAFVYGDSLRAQLVAVAVPDPDALLPWAAAHGLGGDVPSLCANPAVRAAVLASMLDEGRAAKLRGFEQVAAVALAPDPFSVDNGLLTPTFKLKRPQAQAAFKGEIDAMYAALG